ncbi:putative nucleoredoxin 1 [Apium graveolens]|uniref:putative nucleoredoxin 1 n=1 Tax=Apium graveolens TaxID=4045 RepID=UPI003D7AA118
MPWLALPFKDPNYKKLQMIFDHPEQLKELGPEPTLVIIGPHGNFIEEFGTNILLNFGIAAYPFTHESAAKLEAEKAKTLKLEMFWRDPNTLFRQKDGKRTILLFGDGWFNNYVDFFRMLKSRYLQMKNTTNEFEVIHISYKVSGSSYKQHVAATRSLTYPPFALDSPWLTHPAFAYESDERKLLLNVFHFGRGLLAFNVTK